MTTRRWIAVALAAALAAGSGVALAQRGGGGGGAGGHGSGGWSGGGGHGGGNWNGGGWHGGGGNWHGGGWHGGRWHGSYSVVIGGPYWWGAWPYSYYYPYYAPAYYPVAYPVAYPAGYPVYSTGGNAWYVDGAAAEPYRGATVPPPADNQAAPAPLQAPQGTGRPPPPKTYQYYCPDAGYYPAVKACPQGWLRVVPEAPPQ